MEKLALPDKEAQAEDREIQAGLTSALSWKGVGRMERSILIALIGCFVGLKGLACGKGQADHRVARGAGK